MCLWLLHVWLYILSISVGDDVLCRDDVCTSAIRPWSSYSPNSAVRCMMCDGKKRIMIQDNIRQPDECDVAVDWTLTLRLSIHNATKSRCDSSAQGWEERFISLYRVTCRPARVLWDAVNTPRWYIWWCMCLYVYIHLFVFTLCTNEEDGLKCNARGLHSYEAAKSTFTLSTSRHCSDDSAKKKI